MISKIGAREKKNNQILALVFSFCLAMLIWHFNFFGLGRFKSNRHADAPVEVNNLPSATDSKASVSISIEDIEEVKSKKWKYTGDVNNKDTAFDKTMNDAFGDKV